MYVALLAAGVLLVSISVILSSLALRVLVLRGLYHLWRPGHSKGIADCDGSQHKQYYNMVMTVLQTT